MCLAGKFDEATTVLLQLPASIYLLSSNRNALMIVQSLCVRDVTGLNLCKPECRIFSFR
jgi:hypothetical protein